MKTKILTLTFLCCLFTQFSFAQQTYYYHCSKRITADGVMEKMDHSEYLTFSGDIMYESDSEGNIKYFNGTALIYKYFETVDGNRYYYLWTEPVSAFGMTAGGFNKSFGYIISSDYSVINSISNYYSHKVTDVYYRTTESAVKKEKDRQVQGLIR